MLSVGKLGIGQQGYYLEQAQGPVTRTQAVSSGVEDYYLSGPEAPGVWSGAGASALGLKGSVAVDPLARVLAGEHPSSGEPLGRVLRDRRPGFDLAYSAPKSVSVLFGIGDDRLRAVIRDAHDRAVIEAMGYMEREAAVTRRGAGGAQAIKGNGFVAAAFRHRTSRAGDPQLHTHVLVANLTLGADGQWSTLDGRRIYAHAKTAGYLYEARLRSELTRQLGVEWTPVRNGIADIAGVPPTVLRAFSRRRAEIEAELERHGDVERRRGAGRGARDASREGLPRDARAARAGVARASGRARADAGGGRGAHRARAIDTGARGRRRADHHRLAGPFGLTERRSTFTRRDVLQAWCEQLPADADVSVGRDRAARRRLPALAARRRARRGRALQSLRRRDGTLIPAAGAERTYSTPQLLALEQGILKYAIERRAAGVGLAMSRICGNQGHPRRPPELTRWPTWPGVNGA